MPEQADTQRRLLDDAGFVAKLVQVEDIHLVRAVAERNFETDTPPPVIKFGFDVRSTWNPESQRIKVKVDFSFRAFFDESEDDQPPPLFVEVRFALSYALTSTDGIDEQKVDAFGKMNGVYNAWPYIREFVQSTLTRLSLPTLTLPVLTSEMLTGFYRKEEQFASSSVDNGCVE